MQTLNLCKNDIRDISEIVYLNYLLKIDAKENQIRDVQFFHQSPESLQFLQVGRLIIVTVCVVC